MRFTWSKSENRKDRILEGKIMPKPEPTVEEIRLRKEVEELQISIRDFLQTSPPGFKDVFDLATLYLGSYDLSYPKRILDSWTSKLKHEAEQKRKRDEIEAVVLDVLKKEKLIKEQK
jgi:hypothetical protein